MEAAKSRKEKVLSRREIESMIAEGRKIFILDGKVIKADAWLPYHPGGYHAILHMVGKDATDEARALHSPKTLKRMETYQIGRIEHRWVNFEPPIQGGKFRLINEAVIEDESAIEQIDHDSSNSSSSDDGSPLFEPADTQVSDSQLRNRGQPRAARNSSSSSVSSVDLGNDEKPKGPSHFDARTQQQIELDLSQYPPLDPETQDDIVLKYRQLYDRIIAEGLFDCDYWVYFRDFLRISTLFILCWLLFHNGWYKMSAIPLGLAWHQLAFIVHDAAHMGITHDFTIDTLISIVVADFIGGLSAGWWKRNHNVHHIVTNSPEHDPDIQHIPFFAVSHRFLESLRSTYYERVLTYDAASKILVPLQQYLYYPLLALARFNLYANSYIYLFGGQAPRKGPAWWTLWIEIIGQMFFWTWFGYFTVYKGIDTNWNRFAFVLISNVVASPVHLQIVLSHFAMSTADLGVHESFPQKMLRTTMDVDCPPWMDFVHGGLQFQAIHHLYPRLPRPNMRRTQRLVQDFCDEVNIPYALYGFVDGNKKVIGHLGDVGRQAVILAECQKAMMTEGFHAH